VSDAGVSDEVFGVETIELDLPALAGALSRRLHDAGVLVTPARSADLARALSLVRPITRRRLYWTARAVLVSDPGHVRAFDAVFFAIFGDRGEEAFEPDAVQTVPAPADERGAPDHKTSPGEAVDRDSFATIAPRSPGAGDDDSEGCHDEHHDQHQVAGPLELEARIEEIRLLASHVGHDVRRYTSPRENPNG